jgi:AcrR family transcriptional regulator
MNDASRTPTPRHHQAVARREQILSTAVKLFGTQGFAATTTRQIAQAAGITEGLIFRYFPTKVSILHTLANERDSLAHATLSQDIVNTCDHFTVADKP